MTQSEAGPSPGGPQPTMSYTALASRNTFAGSFGTDDLPSNIASARFFAGQEDPLATLNSNLGEGGVSFASSPSATQGNRLANRAGGRGSGAALPPRVGTDRPLVSRPHLALAPSGNTQTRLSMVSRSVASPSGPAVSSAAATDGKTSTAFKKIPLRGATRSARTAQAFQKLAGRTGPVTSDDVVQDLAATYTQRRQFMERASQMTSEMRAKANDIAAIDELNRQLGFKGDVGHLQDTIERQLAEAQQQQQPKRGPSHATNGDDEGDQQTFFSASDNTEDPIDAKAKDKLTKVLKLRTIQRRIGELDDEADEEEQRYAVMLKKRQALQERGGYESRRGSMASVQHSAAASPNASHNSPQSLKRTLSAHSASRLRHVQEPRVTAGELRQQFDALLDGTEDADAALPDPPRHFTSHSLAVTLEILSQCLARIVDATDSICVSATFRGTGETIDVFYDIDKCLKNYAHTRLCFNVALGHLGHFEVGEKAILEGGQFEVNSLREQFLMRKEMLTAQEQKQAAAEENCQALRLRIRKARERMAMWDEVVFGHAPSVLLHDDDEENQTPRSSGGAKPRSQDGRVPLQRTGSRQSTQFHVPGSSRAFGSRGHGPGGSGPRRASASPIRLTTLGDYLASDAVSSSASSTHEVPRQAYEKPLAPLYAEQDVPLSAEDAMELRVARTWGNPYVTKALQYQQVTHLMPLYERHLEQQQQQQQHEELRHQAELQPSGASSEVARSSEFGRWPQQVSPTTLTPPTSSGGGGEVRLGVGRLSTFPSHSTETQLLPAVLPGVVVSGGRPAEREALSVTTTNATLTDSSPDPQSTVSPSAGGGRGPLLANSNATSTASSRIAPQLPSPLPISLSTPWRTVHGTDNGSVLYAPTAGAPLSISVPSHSFSTDASRNTTLPASSAPLFLSQRIADERLLTLLQALLRVIPTERSYVSCFTQGMSDDDEDNGDAATASASPKTNASASTSSPNKQSGARATASVALSPSRAHTRAGKGRALPRLVAYDVQLSTEEKTELAGCQAARSSAERLVQFLSARNKTNASRM